MNDNTKLNIVMFNMSKYGDWQKGIVNRNFHILHNLAKHPRINKIISVDFLPFTWKKAVKTYIKDQILRDTRGSIVYGDLTSRCWHVNPKILVYSTIDSMLETKKISSEINKIIAKEKMEENLIVWNYNPMFINYFHYLNQKINIFDAVDNWQEHSSYKNYKKILYENYLFIKKKSDLIFTVSESLKENLFDNLNKAHWIPNAVDLDYFQSQTKPLAKLEKIKKPIIGFLGILQDRIDVNIITIIAKNHQDKSIVLAGPIWKNFPKKILNEYKNIHFLGPIKWQDIPSLYNGFDIGIIPYKTNQFIKSTDPMKYYEYLAAGLPVISTKAPNHERFSKLINFTNNPEEFSILIDQLVKVNRGQFKKRCYEFLNSHTWKNRVENMVNLITEKL